MVLGHRLAVGAVGGHRVVGVHDLEDARPDRDLLPGESRGIAGPVPALVVVEEEGRGDAEVVDALEQRPPETGVIPHQMPLLGGERPVLEQDRVRDPDLADVVEQRTALDDGDLGFGDAQLHGQPACVAGHPLGVPLRARIARVEGSDEPLQQGLGTLADDLLQPEVLAPQRLRQLVVLPPQRDHLGRLPHRRDELHLLGRLGDDAVHLAYVDGLDDDLRVGVRAAQDPRRPGAPGDRQLEERDPVHVGHDVVGDDDVGPFDLDGGERLERPRVAAGLEPGPLQHAGQELEDQLVVVDEKDAGHGEGPDSREPSTG